MPHELSVLVSTCICYFSYRDVTRCRDGESVSKVCVLKANVHQVATMSRNTPPCSWTFSDQLVFPCSGIRHSPPSLHLYLLLFWKQPESRIQNVIKIFGATTGHRNRYRCDFEATSKVSLTDCDGHTHTHTHTHTYTHTHTHFCSPCPKGCRAGPRP